MKQVIISTKIDQATKKQRLNVGLEDSPSKHLLTEIHQSESEITEGQTLSFETSKQVFEYLDSEIDHEKHTKSED